MQFRSQKTRLNARKALNNRAHVQGYSIDRFFFFYQHETFPLPVQSCRPRLTFCLPIRIPNSPSTHPDKGIRNSPNSTEEHHLYRTPPRHSYSETRRPLCETSSSSLSPPICKRSPMLKQCCEWVRRTTHVRPDVAVSLASQPGGRARFPADVRLKLESRNDPFSPRFRAPNRVFPMSIIE